MEHNPKPRRRWFRLSLRTMLVLVTLVCMFCGYVGWAMNWQRQRQKFLKRPPWGTILGLQKRAPIALWLIGENGVSSIRLVPPLPTDDLVANDATVVDIQRIVRLFPESDVIVYVNQWDGDPSLKAYLPVPVDEWLSNKESLIPAYMHKR
jgi:hypothetical protein